MAVDRNGVAVQPGDLVEVAGQTASGKQVVAVADAGIYVKWRDRSLQYPYRFLRDKDRCFTTLGPEL